MTDMIGVVAVDDHQLFIDGLTLCLQGEEGIELRASAHDIEGLMEALDRERPAVALVDAELPGTSGIDAIPQILRASPGIRVLVVSAFQDTATIAFALEQGAAGYVPKAHTADLLIDGIRRVAAGETFVPAGYERRLVEAMLDRKRLRDANDALEGNLSGREREVLGLLADGMATEEIAERLFISRFTVRGHVQSIIRKLGVRSKVEAVARAYKTGLVKPTGSIR